MACIRIARINPSIQSYTTSEAVLSVANIPRSHNGVGDKYGKSPVSKMALQMLRYTVSSAMSLTKRSFSLLSGPQPVQYPGWGPESPGADEDAAGARLFVVCYHKPTLQNREPRACIAVSADAVPVGRGSPGASCGDHDLDLARRVKLESRGIRSGKVKDGARRGICPLHCASILR